MPNPGLTPTTEDVLALVDSWAVIWNGDLSRVDESVHQSFVAHAAPLLGGAPSDTAGREHLIDWVNNTHAVLSDLNFTIQVGPIIDGPFVALRWHAVGTYQGGIPGASTAADGRSIEFFGTDTLRIVDRLIVEYWANADSLWAAQQLGVKIPEVS